MGATQHGRLADASAEWHCRRPRSAYLDFMHKKPHLPTKICAACARPFAWRKKWVRDWEAVRFCSERCRRTGSTRPADDQR